MQLLVLILLAQTAAARGTRTDVSLGEGMSRARSSGVLIDSRDDAPLFSFASAAPGYKGYAVGAGLPAADGCHAAANVTGTKGEALTFTRATTRFCPTSANEATGVMCASGEVCITSSGSTRGISIFRAGTNTVLRSEETDNAAWTVLNAIAVAPTKDSANSSVAPDGTTTAEIVTWPAVVGATTYSFLRQSVTVTTGHVGFMCVWLKKTGGAGSKLWLGNGTSTGNAAVDCAPTSSWKKCCVSVESTTGAVGVDLGGNGFITAQSTSPMPDGISAAVWGWHLMTGASAPTYASPYVKTEGTAVTRNAETATFPVAWEGGNVISTAFTSATRGGAALLTSQTGLALHSSFPSAGPSFLSYATTFGSEWRVFTTATDRASVAPADAAPVRVANGCDGTNSFSIWGGASTTNGTNCDAIPNTSDTLAVGWFTTNTQMDGIISNVCVDASPTRCR